MGYVIDYQDSVLDEFGLSVLVDIKERSAANPPYLFDVLDNPCIKTAIAVYNKLLELEHHDYLSLRVDACDCRVQYVCIRHKGDEAIAQMKDIKTVS
jgi:hypothetical protein